MAGKNLFEGFGAGDLSKYERANSEAIRKEQGKELSRKIKKFTKVAEADVAWANKAIAFVDEARKAYKDVLDRESNGKDLDEIEHLALSIIDEKETKDRQARLRRIRDLDSLIVSLNKESRSFDWAQRVENLLGNVEKNNADIFISVPHGSLVPILLDDAKEIIAKEEKRRKEERERLAFEAEERRLDGLAANADARILELSQAEKDVSWCDAVEGAAKKIKRLESSARKRCKNLGKLDELSSIVKDVRAAAEFDKKIVDLMESPFDDDDAWKCGEVRALERQIPDAARRYMKETEDLKRLSEIAAAHFKAEEEKEAELKRQAAQKKEEERLKELRVRRKKKRDAVLSAIIPLLITALILGATFAGYAFFPDYRNFIIAGGLLIATVWTYVACVRISWRYWKILPLIFHLPIALGLIVHSGFAWPDYRFEAVAASICLEAVLMVIYSAVRLERRGYWIPFFIFLGAASCFALAVLWGKIGIDQSAPYAALDVVIAVGVAFFLLALWCFLHFVAWDLFQDPLSGRKLCNIICRILELGALAATIVFLALNGRFILLCLACGGVSFLLDLICYATFCRRAYRPWLALSMGLSLIFASIAAGMTFCENLFLRGLVIGIPCLVSFIPLFVSLCRCNDGTRETRGFFTILGFFLALVSIGFGVAAIVESGNLPGYLFLVNLAFLLYGVLFLIASGAVLRRCYFPSGVIIMISIAVGIFLAVAFPISLVKVFSTFLDVGLPWVKSGIVVSPRFISIWGK